MVQNHVTTQVPEVGVMVHAALGRHLIVQGRLDYYEAAKQLWVRTLKLSFSSGKDLGRKHKEMSFHTAKG